MPIAGGEVTAVDATSITVKGKAGVTRVITVNDATVYQLGKAPGSKADVKVGTHVNAQGTTSGDTFTAITVRVSLPDVAGEVSAKTADSITIKRRDGSTTVIHVTDKTTYEVRGKDPASLADIAVGDRVGAEGLSARRWIDGRRRRRERAEEGRQGPQGPEVIGGARHKRRPGLTPERRSRSPHGLGRCRRRNAGRAR